MTALIVEQQQGQTRLETVDEFGFIVMTEEQKHKRWERLQLSRHMRGGAEFGYARVGCKSLCRRLKHMKRLGTRQALAGLFWCSNCECIMKCCRCRCCGRIGRGRPRTRNRDLGVKRID